MMRQSECTLVNNDHDNYDYGRREWLNLYR
jgi:hypothetical protein